MSPTIFFILLPETGLALIFGMNLDIIAEFLLNNWDSLLVGLIALYLWDRTEYYRNRRLGNSGWSKKRWFTFTFHTISIFIISGISYYLTKEGYSMVKNMLLPDSLQSMAMDLKWITIFDIIDRFDSWQIYLCAFILLVFIIIIWIYIDFVLNRPLNIILLWNLGLL